MIQTTGGGRPNRMGSSCMKIVLRPIGILVLTIQKRVKIQIFIVSILLSFLFVGCATAPTFRSKCAARAIYAAVTIGLQKDSKIPVRIAYGKTSNPGTTHVQAQAFIEGKWEFLKIIGPNKIGIGKKYKSFNIKRYVSVETFSKWLIYWLRNGKENTAEK